MLESSETPAPERRILLIEDDEVDAEMFKRALRRRSLPVVLDRAIDGQQALEMLLAAPDPRQSGPDLCVLDLNMPRLDGLSFLARMRETPELASTVVFVLSTSAAPRDVEAAYRHHVAGYMVKEVTDGKLDGCMDLLQAYLSTSVLPFRVDEWLSAGSHRAGGSNDLGRTSR